MPSSSSPATHVRRRGRTLAAVAAGLTAVGAVVLAFTLDAGPSGGASHNSPVAGTSTPDARSGALLALARRDADDPLALGRADAPVVMIEYSDFQCPYCGKFARGTEPELVRSYVDKGLLRIEWRNFPIFGAESEQAARAAWAAGQQGRFWEFHDEAYRTTHKKNTGAFSAGKLTDMARAAGVADIGEFRADMASDKADTAIRRDREEGYDLGVTSTPAFLVNDVPVLGAQPADTFKQVIEAAAKAAR
ncbi:DsbA family protein [Streptomyces luomodiensis]|uniref:DsbA family protein n=1 Tax=Streptomyces luomodiensis TaxID=3026192 RepID=A0ABY9V6P0_9ACTN|nr:DsbA family protein [Streptomyces sp. SCA4-21]WNF00307.1 DsbA family protein [Streptomyces sp. SCA4-21]